MTEFALASLESIEEIEDGRCPFRPIRHHFGITTFGVNAMTARSDGDRLINEHDEAEPESGEELYFVTTGHATFELDGAAHDAPAGTFVHVRPGVMRTAIARDAGTTILAIGAGPRGVPYAPSGWELFAPLMPLFQSGEYELGADRAAALVADDPPFGGLFYNTACFESRAGRSEAALTHLKRAVELSPWLADLARKDEDFEPLRADPAFAEIIAAG